MGMKRGTHSQELNNLLGFLNLKLAKKDTKTALGNPSKYGPSAQTKKFISAHGLTGTLSELWTVQGDIGHLLRCLQPEVFEAIPPERGDAQRRAMVRNLSTNSTHFLNSLIDGVNRAEYGSQWILQPAEADAANLNFRGTWHLKKSPVGGRAQIFAWVAKIVDQDELSKLRCCRVCRRFFIPVRRKQKYCRSQECKHDVFDERMKGPRKANLRLKKESELQERGLPRFKELVEIDCLSEKFSHVRASFGEKTGDFNSFAKRVDQGEPAEKVWPELPSWMKKNLAGDSRALAVGRPVRKSL